MTTVDCASNSSTSMKMNNRLNNLGAGALYDIGTFAINSVRQLFKDESNELFGYKPFKHGRSSFKTNFDMSVALLRFPTADYYAVGIRGLITVTPVSDFTQKITFEVTICDTKNSKLPPCSHVQVMSAVVLTPVQPEVILLDATGRRKYSATKVDQLHSLPVLAA